MKQTIAINTPSTIVAPKKGFNLEKNFHLKRKSHHLNQNNTIQIKKS